MNGDLFAVSLCNGAAIPAKLQETSGNKGQAPGTLEAGGYAGVLATAGTFSWVSGDPFLTNNVSQKEFPFRAAYTLQG